MDDNALVKDIVVDIRENIQTIKEKSTYMKSFFD